LIVVVMMVVVVIMMMTVMSRHSASFLDGSSRASTKHDRR